MHYRAPDLVAVMLLAGCVTDEAQTVSQASTQVTKVFSAGPMPQAVAVNPVTNEVVVANGGNSNTVTFIHLADGSTSTVPLLLGHGQTAIAVLGNGGVLVSSVTGELTKIERGAVTAVFPLIETPIS